MSIESKQRTSTIKVGILTLLSVGLLIAVLIWLRGRSLSGGVHYEVRFKDINGMREGCTVQMMGVRIGFVDSIKAIQSRDGRFYVQVGFTINKDLKVHVPMGSHLSIEQSGLIGDQFLEVTPPQLHDVTLTTFQEPAKAIQPGLPVKFLYEQGYLLVGQVERVEQMRDGNFIRYRLLYRITRPGAELPPDPVFELTMEDPSRSPRGSYYLRILPRNFMLAQSPDPNLSFTVETPMRFKRFMEIQIESAEALKLTNNKIIQLLSDETIDTLQSTLKNTEVLTARASDVMQNANLLFKSTRQDFDSLAVASNRLMAQVSDVSENVNRVIADPKLRDDLHNTLNSLQSSAQAMQTLLQDPSLKESMHLTRDTSKNADILMTSLRKTAEDENLQNRLNNIVNQLDTSMTQLSGVLTQVNEITGDKKQSLKETLEDAHSAAKNLKKASEKLNGHFALFKMMF